MGNKYREYAEKVSSVIEGTEVIVVSKSNGGSRVGIVYAGHKGSPVVYTNSMCDEGVSIEDASERVRDLLNTHQIDGDGIIETLRDWERVKPQLRARVFNVDKHNCEVYETAPYLGFTEFKDWVVTPYVFINIGEDNGVVPITSKLLEWWGVDTDTVLALAMQQSAHYKVNNFMGMAYVTNGEASYGAIGVLFAQEELRKMYPEGYYVLPSSVHECIVIPRGSCTLQEAKNMVREVNSSVLDESELLSFEVYEFN